ncbi:hypothetical protein PR048_014040 [Dryococelus australis]|uniref:Reverse transcriptase RNase H-like domain-containing protein n=1 Tax=Dryococelus australis TaxID=614101 RepID=A0ABQ9HTU8_9NEOP|nr:hypothetical protein PR048_014040 [Dryococelus australis]
MEKKWAQIEEELLAIVYATNTFHYYIYGHPVQVPRDRKPLVAVMNKQIKLLKYLLEVQYLLGKMMLIANLLPLAYNNEKVKMMKKCIPSNKVRKEFRRELASDSVFCIVVKLVKTGWPQKKSSVLPHCLTYWLFQNYLFFFVKDELLFLNYKIDVPENLRPKILNGSHEGHFGVVNT